MALLFTLTEGWTKELGPFTIRLNGAPLDLTGLTVELMLRPLLTETYSTTAGEVRVDTDQVGMGKGQVYWKPDAADIKRAYSPYSVRWKLTDGQGNSIYVPNSTLGDTVEIVLP